MVCVFLLQTSSFDNPLYIDYHLYVLTHQQHNHNDIVHHFCTNCFKSLGVPTCMEIYNYIRDHGKATVSRLTEFVQLTQPTVSHHLKEMKDHGLLNSAKVGKEVFYSINEMCPIYKSECVLNHIKFPVSGIVVSNQ